MQELFNVYDPTLSGIASSHWSIRQDIDRLYKSYKEALYKDLSQALTRIHLGFDMWTSPNNKAMMAVTAHYIDLNKRHQSCLLGLRQHEGDHSGARLSQTLSAVVSEWGLSSREIGVVIADNATSNDTCLEHFWRMTDPDLSPRDIKHRRVRCYGHILNLAAKAFLFGQDADAIELESYDAGSTGRASEELELWRRKGPVGKLHNIISYIRRTPQRSESFKRASQQQEASDDFPLHEQSTAELALILDNRTRWNSTYLMVQRALRKMKDLQNWIAQQDFEERPEDRIPDADKLSAEDWKELTEVMNILKPLYQQTKRTEGNGKNGGHGRLWEIMTGVEYLLEHFELWKRMYSDEHVPDVTREPGPPADRRQAASSRRPAPASGGRGRRQASFIPEHARAEYVPRSSPPAGQVHRSTVRDFLPDDHRNHICQSINLAWKKLDSYYTKLGDSPMYSAAIILNPAYGLKTLQHTWGDHVNGSDWIAEAKHGLRAWWERWYRQGSDEGDNDQASEALEPPVSAPADEPDHYQQWLQSRIPRADNIDDELDRYYKLDPVNTLDPVEWWVDHKASFPTVHRLALDILAIPAMAADCERSFSQAKLTLTSQRLSMSADLIERIQCTKNWMRRMDANRPPIFWKRARLTDSDAGSVASSSAG
jgi:hypothetical protein